MAVQRDGKVVLAGNALNGTPQFALVRYKKDGALDTRFGRAGIVTDSLGDPSSVTALALQPDGKVLAGGLSMGSSGTFVFALARYLPNGSPDPTFGSGGSVTTVFQYSSGIHALVVQDDGKIVAAGTSGGDFAMARYNADGSLDTAFGSAGVVKTSFGTTDDLILGLARQSDGKFIAAGLASNDRVSSFALARYRSDGTLDSSFGQGGLVQTRIRGFDEARSVALQRDGRIVVAGDSAGILDAGPQSFTLARYRADGSLDETFGTQGITTAPFAAGGANAVEIQPDGMIVAAGTGASGGESGFALARYRRDGLPDATFGKRGTELTPLSAGSDIGSALAIRNEKILVAGTADASNSNKSSFALARYLGFECQVPNLGRKRLKQARRLIRRQHCSVGKIRTASSRAVPRGRVVSQRPIARSRQTQGHKVDLVVSRGPSKT